MINAIRRNSLFVKGQKQARLSNWKESVRLFDRAISLTPDYGGIYLHKAIALSKMKQYPEAINVLKKGISLNPSNPACYLFLGVIHYDYQQIDDALSCFDKALELAPDNILARCFKQLVLMAKNDNFNDAYESLLTDVVNTNSEFQSRLLVFCESLILKHLDRAMYLEETFFNDEYLKQGSERSFLENLLKSFGIKYNSIYFNTIYLFSPKKRKAYHHYLTGVVKLLNHDLSGAEDEFVRALTDVPEFYDARERLISIYIYQKRYQKIYKYIKDLEGYNEIRGILEADDRVFNPDDKIKLKDHLMLLSVLSHMYFYEGKYDRAIRSLNFVTENSDGYYHLYYLGVCCLAKNDADAARMYFKESMEQINPNIAKRRLEEAFRLRNN